MRTVQVPVLRVTPEAFARYGSVVGRPSSKAPDVRLSELEYWDKVVDLSERLTKPELGFLETRHRPFAFSKMERHVLTPEAFIPVAGVSLFPVAPASALGAPGSGPGPEEVAAFILDGSCAVNLDPGVWHWAPFPLADVARFVLVLRKGTVEEDIDTCDLAATKQVVLRLALP